MKVSAAQAKIKAMKRAKDAIAMLEDILDELESANAIAPRRWDFVGDMNSIANELERIVERYKS
jgi:hypothetical protein